MGQTDPIGNGAFVRQLSRNFPRTSALALGSQLLGCLAPATPHALPDASEDSAAQGSGSANEGNADTQAGTSTSTASGPDTGTTGGEPDTGGPCEFGPVKAFPTAEGFGANAIGGRGGTVLHVTQLGDSGDGSLRAAMEATGPRIVVFDVAGIISLQSPIAIAEANSYVTLAGQTAPGDGIIIRDQGLEVRTGAHDVVFRHVDIRPGAALAGPPGDPGSLVVNGLLAWGENDTHVDNVIFDHMTVMWSVRDNALFWANVSNATLQWSLIAESITDEQYAGSTSKGLLASGTPLTLSLHHNLFADNGAHNPSVNRGVLVDFRSNVVFNWSCNNGASFGGWCSYGNPASVPVNFVDNVFIPGADATCGNFVWFAGPETKVYAAGNRGPNCPEGCEDDWDFGFMESYFSSCDATGITRPADPAQFRAATEFDAPAVTATDASELLTVLAERVGSDRPKRDAQETRVITEVQDGTGRVGKFGDYPPLQGGTPPLDSDADGMPDAWEASHGLDPMNPGDGAEVARNGYTNIENYINELAGDEICL